MEKNPAHYCLVCDKYIGFRGFCSKECHNKYYGRFKEDAKKKTR